MDTLAYTYTRPCPKVTRPRQVAADLPADFASAAFERPFSAAFERVFCSARDNVIIRLCAMECNYAAPLSDDSNKEFQVDIVNWSKVSQRIFIWDCKPPRHTAGSSGVGRASILQSQAA